MSLRLCVYSGYFIRFCLQNNGRISASKRTDHFEFLSDSEIVQMEEVVRNTYGRENTVE
jgi:hypothetical protein